MISNRERGGSIGKPGKVFVFICQRHKTVVFVTFALQKYARGFFPPCIEPTRHAFIAAAFDTLEKVRLST